MAKQIGKKILYITAKFPFGKSEVWAINELSSLQELGSEIIIVPRTGRGEIINEDAEKFAGNLIDLPFLNRYIFQTTLQAIFFDPLFLIRILVGNIHQSNTLMDFVKGLAVLPKSLAVAKILNTKNIDHIHSLHTTSTAFMAFIISKKLDVSWSYTLHSTEIIKPNYRRSLLFRSRSASMCRTISQKIKDELSLFLGPDLSKKVVKVHLGVDVKGKNNVKSECRDEFTIVTPAALVPQKGHVFAINAAKRLIDLGVSDFKWVFYGSGTLLEKLRKNVGQLGLTGHCFFLGNVDHQELLNEYREKKINAVVLPSIGTLVPEGIPVSLMEAMSFEVPVIATNCGGTGELVDGHSGFLIDEGDSEALATSLIELIENPELGRKMGQNGKNKVKVDFDTMKNAQELLKFF